MKHLIIIAALTIVFALTVSSQGLYWESTGHISVMGNDREINSTFFAMPKMFKSVDGKEHESILRLDKGVILEVNNTDKTYTQMTFEELDAMMKKGTAKMDESMAELKEKMKDMPEEQRKMVEQMMGKTQATGSSEGKYTVKNTGVKEKISGYSCTKYIISQGDREVLTLWASKDVKGVDALKKDMQEFRDRMAAMMPKIGSAMAEGMKNVEGFPIRVESANYKSTVTKIEQRTTPANAFEPPKGYKKTKLESFDDKVEEKD
jgi:hypothetical protein